MIEFIKKEKILCIAWILAICSAFFVRPDKEYLKYIDMKVIALLFCLMILVKGFQSIGVFDVMIRKVLESVHSSRKLAQMLVLLCFFLSMVITNDVALITFVPFAIQALRICKQEKIMIKVIVLQTIAANLGSMFTPIGNPQNLFLFSVSQMELGTFFKVMLPLTLVSLVFLMGMLQLLPDEKIQVEMMEEELEISKKELLIYGVLFAMNLLVVFRVLHWFPVLLLTAGSLFLMKKNPLFYQVDYSLLLTFAGFFIFVGNAARITWFHEAIGSIIQGRELGMAILFSQFLSNVPTALLLSGFTDNYSALLAGTNIGGLGTIIASMASLISYKLYLQLEEADKSKYMRTFTSYNLIGLGILIAFVFVSL